jgi:hypothetical protein
VEAHLAAQLETLCDDEPYGMIEDLLLGGVEVCGFALGM